MTEDPAVVAAQAECDLAMAAMVAAVIPVMEFIARHVAEAETDEALGLLDDYRVAYDTWMLASATLATVRAEHG